MFAASSNINFNLNLGIRSYCKKSRAQSDDESALTIFIQDKVINRGKMRLPDPILPIFICKPHVFRAIQVYSVLDLVQENCPQLSKILFTEASKDDILFFQRFIHVCLFLGKQSVSMATMAQYLVLSCLIGMENLCCD